METRETVEVRLIEAQLGYERAIVTFQSMLSTNAHKDRIKDAKERMLSWKLLVEIRQLQLEVMKGED